MTGILIRRRGLTGYVVRFYFLTLRFRGVGRCLRGRVLHVGL